MTIEYRHITHKDDQAFADIAALWTYYIEETVITFNPVPKTAAEIRQTVSEKQIANEPMIAAYRDDKFLGFATYGPFRNGEGYKYSKEHTVMLNDGARGAGAGRILMQALEDHANKQGIQSLWAGITGSNQAAIAFHVSIGFEHVTRISEIGWKFDLWHDLVLMRKQLR